MTARTRIRRLAPVVAVALVVSCSFGTSDSSGTSASRGSQAPSTPATPPADESDTSSAVPVDVDQIVTRTLTSMEPRYHATWPELPGTDALNRVLADEVKGQVSAFASDARDAEQSELNIGWQLIADADAVVAVRLASYRFAGANGVQTSRTWWYDAAEERVLTNNDLIADSSALASALVASADDPDADAAEIRRLTEAGLSDLTFTEAGELRVRFDEYAVAPGSSGKVDVVLDSARTELLLTDFGKRARDAAAALADDDAGALVTPAPAEAGTAQEGESGRGDRGSQQGKQRRGTEGKRKEDAGDRGVDCRKARCVALTFDDGPVAGTEKLLRTLRSLDAPATFFVLGQQVATYPEIVARAQRHGHEIGIHTWDHKQLTKLGPKKIRQQLTTTVNEVRRATGEKPTLMRPPYGATGPRVGRVAGDLGLAQVLWSVDTRDWARDKVRPIVKEVRRSTERGDIVLMHDIHENSVDAVPKVIKALRKQGYTLVTVSDLLDDTTPGQVYYSAP